MTDFATISLPAAGDPAWLYGYLGFTPDNAYGFRTEEDGTHVLVVRTEDLPRVAAAAEDYDALFLEHKLKPAALDRAWELRKINMSRMVIGSATMALDDTTIARLSQAKALLDEADKRGVPLNVIKWELYKGQFVAWPAQVIQDTAFASGMHVQQTFAHQSDLYDAIRAATSAEELADVDLESGWPNQ